MSVGTAKYEVLENYIEVVIANQTSVLLKAMYEYEAHLLDLA